MFVAGANFRYLGVMVAIGIGGILSLAWRISERQGRLLAFIHPDQYEKREGHQQFMSLIALGSGGIDGLGLGNSRQKMYYLPYAETDFIFPVIGEELGLRVTLVIVFCYLLILTAGTLIALNAKDRFGMLLGFGCTFMVGLQASSQHWCHHFTSAEQRFAAAFHQLWRIESVFLSYLRRYSGQYLPAGKGRATEPPRTR